MIVMFVWDICLWLPDIIKLSADIEVNLDFSKILNISELKQDYVIALLQKNSIASRRFELIL